MKLCVIVFAANLRAIILSKAKLVLLLCNAGPKKKRTNPWGVADSDRALRQDFVFVSLEDEPEFLYAIVDPDLFERFRL